jgi:hypothetical protein
MPTSTKPGWIDWRDCASKHIIMDDLKCGILPVDADELSAEEAWELVYQHLAEFVKDGVVFSQFKERLADHRKKIGDDTRRASRELAALTHDRLLCPRQMENHRGHPVFDLSPAKLLLRQDVADRKHLTMTPTELRQFRIVEYGPFGKFEFRHRIYQAVRREKFINWMEQKRDEKYKSLLEKREKKKNNNNK